VFKSYNETGNYILEEYIVRAIKKVYSPMVVTSELPSSGRIRVRESKAGDFLALHVLYAPPINRGNVCLLPDFPKLHDVCITLKVDRQITSATLEPDGEGVRFSQSGNILTIYLPPFRLHALLILK
jgi:hypothetical protein